ncbi:glycosyltransferase involved in cell wall biosynthesis [Arthrobacter pascens]|uniref:glycosyltransferase family 2 protein n=1 Tax=Arthrobacter pascens TaxID=1677 RepID=UPI00278B17C9|nr:glycosyltransferase [Arthrobacter pascens]MDQ0636127.1 glycosyltransferase involved in cell wall biosynthesis [Arthrobacter pascens]
MRICRPQKSLERASVTVVIPCYNYGKYLPQVVNSVLSQERVDVRIIIVDDASPDGSAKVATAIADTDARISVVAHAENEGHIGTYNDGLARIETTYAVLLSADDLLAPHALARATDLMAAHPAVGMVYGRPVDFNDAEGSPSLSSKDRSTWTVWRGSEWLHLASYRGRCFILSPEVVMRTEAMREVGYYNPELPHSGDLEYWLRLASRWDIGYIHGPPQAFYRVHESNMHLLSYSSMATDLSHRLKAFLAFCSTYELRDDTDGRAILRLARRALAREALLLAQRELDTGGSQETAIQLASTATEADRKAKRNSRYRKYRRRLSRAEAGSQPNVQQILTELVRKQMDRMRWRVWKAIGIS